MKLLYFIIGCVALYKCVAQLQTRVCGPSLSQLLQTVCENGFNPKFDKKSNVPPYLFISKLSKRSGKEPLQPLFADMLFNKRPSAVASARQERIYSGVYDECCRKTCSFNEIVDYCL
ncbi:probable insulin-like peptide 5 [Musca domestica]|uniref:Probable insulin-like peptide 5 n=1 Tax=Musca domestica TaxID=7370 RepID=A0A1I8NJJ7_MUSDO|nr:probable insulin-like peptide 5 [Musca domestica]